MVSGATKRLVSLKKSQKKLLRRNERIMPLSKSSIEYDNMTQHEWLCDVIYLLYSCRRGPVSLICMEIITSDAWSAQKLDNAR